MGAPGRLILSALPRRAVVPLESAQGRSPTTTTGLACGPIT